MKNCLFVQSLLWFVRDKHANQIVHLFVFLVFLALVNVEFFAKQGVPVLLQFGLRGLPNHFALNLHAACIFVVVKGLETWGPKALQEPRWVFVRLITTVTLRNSIRLPHEVDIAHRLIVKALLYHIGQFVFALLLVLLSSLVRNHAFERKLALALLGLLLGLFFVVGTPL